MSKRADIAYCAGLFEGEGCVFTSARQPARMTVKMTDREPLCRLLDVLGGRILGPYKRGKYKPYWEWRINGWEPVADAFAALRQWLSPRRITQFERALANGTEPARRGNGTYNRIKTHCPKGHPYDAVNTYVNGGRRHCRECMRNRKGATV